MDILIRKNLFKIKKKITGNSGSMSIEGLFTIPIFIFTMVLLIFMIRFMSIDDSFNQCLYEATLDYSMLDNSSSDIINSAILNLLLQKNMNEMDLKLDAIASTVSKGDYVSIKAFYNLEVPFFKTLSFSEDVWIYKREKIIETYFYITPNGKKYHYKDCILTKGNGVKYSSSEIPDGIEACKNCILGNRYFEKKN